MTSRWVTLAVLSLARMAMAVQFQSVAAVTPLVRETFGVGLDEIGFLIGLYLAPGIALALPGGVIGRALGDRRAVLLGLALMLAGGIIPVLPVAWDLVLAGRLLAGSGGVLLNVLMAKMVTDWFAGGELATAMGIYVNSWPVGIALALVILPHAAGVGGLQLAWGAVVIIVGVALLLFAAVYRPPSRGTRVCRSSRSFLPALSGRSSMPRSPSCSASVRAFSRSAAGAWRRPAGPRASCCG